MAMGRTNNLMRLKVDFENTPIMDIEKNIADEKDFDNMIGSLRLKFFGR